MAKEARELEAFFNSKGFPDLAGTMNLVAGVADARGLHHLPLRAEQPFYMLPEGEGVKFIQNIGGKSPEQLEAENKAIREVTSWASDMLHSDKFEVLKEVTPQELLKIPVRALSLPGNPTTRQLYERIPQTKYGEGYVLELPRAEVGPHLGIADKDQPVGDFYYVMHQPITDRDGIPSVFGVVHGSDGRLLSGRWADPGGRWGPRRQLVVALSKIEPLQP